MGKRTLPAALLGLGCFCTAAAAAPIVIDDFERGTLNPPNGYVQVTDAAGVQDTRTGLDPNHVFNGRRDTILIRSSGTLTASLDPDPADAVDDALTYTINGAGNLLLYYIGGTIGNATGQDFIAAGNDRFVLTLAAAPATGTLTLEASDGVRGAVCTVPITEPGTHEIPFNGFVVANGSAVWTEVFAGITSIKINLGAGGSTFQSANGTYVLSDFRAVPEPGSAACIVAAGLMAWWRRQ